MLDAILAAWEQLTAAAWPAAALICLLTWAGVLAKTVQASAKSYANETRITNLEQNSLPTVGGNLGGVVSTATPILFAVSPAGGSDPRNGDQYGAGFTGAIRNWQPSSNPRVVEFWHNVTPPSGWSGGVNRYKNIAEQNMIVVDVQLGSAGASGNVAVMTLPTFYKPANGYSFPLAITTSATTWPNTLRISVDTSGNVTTSSLPSGTTFICATFLLPLD